jgi:hypothetical protein
MRPSPEELLLSLRVSLNDTVLPNVTDKWARYVGTAMDLVLQHLQLRLAGELDAIHADNADMAATVTQLAVRSESVRARLTETTPSATDTLATATYANEQLRRQMVDVLHWLDAEDPSDQDAELRAVRDEVHQLIRRQVDRVNPLVEPLYMSFKPVASS